MTTLSGVSANQLAVANPWSMVPPLGNLDAYISAANRLPMLTLEEEQGFARKLRDQNDLESAGALVLSHLRLVVSISRQYLGYGLPHGDLIQEGNVGLMKAVKRFDPDQGVRLVSYAMHWIKAEIHEYILKNWRMVKVATTKAQRKLFFNLRSMKQGFKADSAAADNGTHRETLSPDEVSQMATRLNVKPEEVLEMDRPARVAAARPPVERRHRHGARGAGRPQPPHCRRALAQGERRRLGRHDIARPRGRVRRERRTHPPDRSRGDEEDEEGARGLRVSHQPLLPRMKKSPVSRAFFIWRACASPAWRCSGFLAYPTRPASARRVCRPIRPGSCSHR